jgi:hypothetical protein
MVTCQSVTRYAMHVHGSKSANKGSKLGRPHQNSRHGPLKDTAKEMKKPDMTARKQSRNTRDTRDKTLLSNSPTRERQGKDRRAQATIRQVSSTRPHPNQGSKLRSPEVPAALAGREDVRPTRKAARTSSKSQTRCPRRGPREPQRPRARVDANVHSFVHPTGKPERLMSSRKQWANGCGPPRGAAGPPGDAACKHSRNGSNTVTKQTKPDPGSTNYPICSNEIPEQANLMESQNCLGWEEEGLTGGKWDLRGDKNVLCWEGHGHMATHIGQRSPWLHFIEYTLMNNT